MGQKFPSNIPDCEIVLHSYLADKKQTYFSDDKSIFNRPSNNRPLSQPFLEGLLYIVL